MTVGTSERRESIYLGIRPGRKPLIGPYKDYLVQRWNEGCRNGQLKMYCEIKDQGYPGSDQAIVRFIAQFRKGKDQARTFKQVDLSKETAFQVPPKRFPTALQISHWMTSTKEQRLDWQNDYLTRLCQVDLLIAQTFKLIQGFTTMLREQRGEQLDEWLKQFDGQGVPELMSFSQGWDRAPMCVVCQEGKI